MFNLQPRHQAPLSILGGVLIVILLVFSFSPATAEAGWFDDFWDDVGDFFGDVLDVIVPAFNSVLCFFGVDTTVGYFEGCGGGGGGQGAVPQATAVSSQSTNASVASTGSSNTPVCPADYPQLCGTLCIPAGAACCASAGYADRYCATGNFCRTDGQCEATSGGQNCSANYNSACQAPVNSCGMTNTGFNSCTGSCQAVTPADSSCPVPNITLTKSPLLFVNSGDTCTLTWTTTNTTSCALVNLNTGATVASGKNGTYATPPMTAQIDFRLNCQNGAIVANSANVSCSLNPAFEEH